MSAASAGSLLLLLTAQKSLKCCLQAMKTVEKRGLQAMAKDIGLDLYSLPYSDARPQRLEWLAQQPVNPPQVSSSLHCGRTLCMVCCAGHL